GTAVAKPFLEADDDTWQADLDLKLFGAVRFSRLVIPSMIERGGGRIVNILNIGARHPPARSVPTTVSRAAGLALTKALSKEFAPQNILVNAIMIGFVKSDQWHRQWEAAGNPGTLDDWYSRLAENVPVGRIAEATELADLVAFLVSERARYITGTAINFDGGQSAVS
ncbi:MAG: SDR family oxidoreductase, partial [Mycetocola sp.]